MEGPSTQYFRSLVPRTILLLVFGTRELEYWQKCPNMRYTYVVSILQIVIKIENQIYSAFGYLDPGGSCKSESDSKKDAPKTMRIQ